MTASTLSRPGTARRGELLAWSLMGLAALAAAGILALVLALARTPVIGEILPYSDLFFRRALVTHVVFSVVIWYLCLLIALSVLSLPPRPSRFDALGRPGLGLTGAGMMALFAVTLLDLGAPSLNNYVPVLVHPAYYAGLGLIAAGVALAILRHMLAGPFDNPASFGVAVGGVCFLLGLVCIGIAWPLVPTDMEAELYNEWLFWGAGHLFQFTNLMLMLIGWSLLTGGRLIANTWQYALFGSVGLGALVAPLLFALHPMPSAELRFAFSDLYVYAIALQPLILGGFTARYLFTTRSDATGDRLGRTALLLSLVLFAVGGAFGFFAGYNDTRTPAHYHAVIGGVNLALFGVVFRHILPALGRDETGRRAPVLLLWLYGLGQLAHSTGLFLAGKSGVERKTAGAAQGLDSTFEIATMTMMGSGAVIAVIGGVMFIWIAGRMLIRALPADPAAARPETR